MPKPTINIEIRVMLLSDMEAIMQLKNAENWNQTEQDWEFLIEQNPNYCFVACIDGLIVGTVTAMEFENKLAWIGMMLVSKNYRGLGISKMLLNTVINKLKFCESIKLDATPAGIPVYKKLGFSDEYEICRMTISNLLLDSKSQFEKSNNSVEPINEIILSEVAKYDQEVYGVNRKPLMQFMLRHKNNCHWCLKEGDLLIGYISGRNGNNYFQIGPLLAASTSEAKILLTAAFQNLLGKPILVDVLKQQPELIEWLTTIGFEVQRDFTRMYLKNNSCDNQIENHFVIAGPELG
ncbi:GNAT family N-acetyltransferase [Aurantibacter crassamenti]|uniref:GNAT family N-acetyltransferase n=1 Tax=Aurantibacter crassamenti TaxID=1837375 RepID=UPI00193A412C|nr:GNAT family N-acetyltransferase [Aurantibacter crassamenti]MBM1104999.1 GNAT family N-acetyltransferase [Aurantibacter crassamenti]